MEYAKEILLPLKVFHDISEVMCGESYVTMPLAIPAFNLIMDDLEEMQKKGLSSIINEAIKVAYTKLKFYYARSDNPVYAVTTLLDPRFKKAYYEVNDWDEEWISWATECLNEVY